jgi:hypothetical protein
MFGLRYGHYLWEGQSVTSSTSSLWVTNIVTYSPAGATLIPSTRQRILERHGPNSAFPRLRSLILTQVPSTL